MLKIRNRLQVLTDYLLGRDCVKGRPVHLTVESTNRCNLRCPMCNRDKDPLPRGDMPFERFRSILDQNQGTLEFVWPYGEGEPLLHPGIFDMIRYAKQRGVRVALSTNATALDEEMSLRLLESGVDHVVFAFLGAHPETYEKYCLGARFDRVKSNIARFLDLKIQRKSKIVVMLQTVLLKDNEREVAEYKRLWNRPGVDVFRFKEDQLKYAGLQAAIYRTKARKALPCFLLWRGPLFIRHDGTVVPCVCFAGSEPLGDLKEASFSELWNSEKMRAFRSAHVRGEVEAYPCRDCTISRPNLPFTVLSMLLSPLTISRLLPFAERLYLFWRFPIYLSSGRGRS